MLSLGCILIPHSSGNHSCLVEDFASECTYDSDTTTPLTRERKPPPCSPVLLSEKDFNGGGVPTATAFRFQRGKWMYTSIPSDEESTLKTYKQTTVSGYQALEVEATLEQRSEPSAPSSTAKQRWVVVAFLIFASILMFTSIIGLAKGRSMPVYSSTNDETRACSFAECQRTMCDPKVAPFVCVSGT